jgi:hypothetical protein
MAVTALPRALVSTRSAGGVHPAILLASLAAPALDLLGLVEIHAALPALSLAWCAVAGLLLLVVWARHPREAWLAAAALAMVASGGLRFSALGGPPAPLLSLLAVLALGVGGAFASGASELDLEAALGDA